MSETYIVDIEEPIEIPAAVYEVEERGTEEPINILLNHNEEPNVIRGYSQPLDGGIRRPDGGLAWYHNNTVCYMRASPITPQESKQAYDAQQSWGEEVSDMLEEIGYPDAEYANADLYVRESPAGHLKQVAGTSAYNSDEVRIERVCWYEDDPRTEQVDELLETDGIDPETFYDSITVPNTSILEHVQEELSPEPVSAEDFISDENREKAEQLQQRETGNIRGSCVLGLQYLWTLL